MFQNNQSQNLAEVTKELAFQNKEKKKRASELVIANKELVFQKTEKKNRAAELVVANKELVFQKTEKKNRAAELVIANKELVFQKTEKKNRAAELVVANKELVFQKTEKKNRAAELVIANKELVFQKTEKKNRAAELVIANKQLILDNSEKEKRAAELLVANKELAFQNAEKEKRAVELLEAIAGLEASEKRYSDLFNLSPQPRWLYDPLTSRCLQVNKAAIDCYGYSEKEFFAMNIHLLGGKKPRLMKKRRPSSLVNNCDFTGRKTHYRKSGKPVEVELYCNLITINEKELQSVLAIDITEKMLYEHKITRAIINTQEEERYEVGAELHDNVCQILASSLMSFRLLKKSLDPSAVDLFNRSQDYILMASEEIRKLSHRLAPAFFAGATMDEAFERLLNEFNAENKFTIRFYFDKAILKANISRDLQLNLYRILQEQLGNILKYANATVIKVDVILHKEKLTLLVADDGIGFNIADIKEGIGISNMKRRAELFFGKFEICSSKNDGCEMIVEIPLAATAAAIPSEEKKIKPGCVQ